MMQAVAIIVRKLQRNCGGAAALEAAIIIPMLAFALFAVFDIAMGFSAKLKFVQAAGRTAELATAPGTVGSDYSYLGPEAATASGQPQSNVTIDSWLECNGARQTSMAVICDNTQQIARYVSVQITGNYNATFNFGSFFGVTGTVPIMGSATVRLQ